MRWPHVAVVYYCTNLPLDMHGRLLNETQVEASNRLLATHDMPLYLFRKAVNVATIHKGVETSSLARLSSSEASCGRSVCEHGVCMQARTAQASMADSPSGAHQF